MHIRLPSLCPDSRDGCTRRKGDRRGACLLCPCVRVCVCVCLYTVRIYICVPRFRNVYARSLRDIRTRMRVTYVCMRYIERYRVARSDGGIERLVSDFKTGHIHGGMENRLQMRRHGTTQLDLSITFFRFSLSLSPSFSLVFFIFFFFYINE